jgi:hypothetical protein
MTGLRNDLVLCEEISMGRVDGDTVIDGTGTDQAMEMLHREVERLRAENEQLKSQSVPLRGLATTPADPAKSNVTTTIELKPGCKITIEYP